MDKLIKGVDEKLWNWFVGYCKQQGITVGEYINNFVRKLKYPEK